MVSKESGHILQKQNERLEAMEREIAELRAELRSMPQQFVEHLRSPEHKKENSRQGVIGRQAKRAGMTKEQWLAHCERTGHDPEKMDKSIPNHEAKGSRGGKRVDKRPRGQRTLTANEERQKQERLGQRTIYDELKKKKR